MALFKRTITDILILLCAVLLVCSNALPCFADDAKALFEFDYNGSHIKTYGTYSVVDGKVCSSHRYFVKSGNLVLIDQSLMPTATGVFIHFDGGKSYIAVLCMDGKLVSLGTVDLCRSLEKFKNSGIKKMSDNIVVDSTTINLEYEDGSKRSYDCITGRLLSSTAATEKKDPGEFVSEYLSDLIDRSTSTGADNSGAKAQDVVNALDESGASLSQLLDAGIVEAIESNYSENGESLGDAGLDLDIDISGLDGVYDYTQNEDYINLMNSKSQEMSASQLAQVKNLFDKIVRGESTAEDAAFLLNLGEDSEEVHYSVDGTAEFPLEGPADSEDSLDSLESLIFDSFKSVEKAKSEKKFIEAKPKEKYLAVYNAEEERYEIYSEKNVMKNPENLIGESNKIADELQLKSLYKLLAGTKHTAEQTGMSIYWVIIVLILAAVAMIVASGVHLFKKVKPAGV